MLARASDDAQRQLGVWAAEGAATHLANRLLQRAHAPGLDDEKLAALILRAVLVRGAEALADLLATSPFQSADGGKLVPGGRHTCRR